MTRKDSEPAASQRYPKEHFLVQLTQQDLHNRPFYVKYFYDKNGYVVDDKPVACTDCDPKTPEIATIRAEIYSGIMEPQGSQFFGILHTPESLQALTVPYKRMTVCAK